MTPEPPPRVLLEPKPRRSFGNTPRHRTEVPKLECPIDDRTKGLSQGKSTLDRRNQPKDGRKMKRETRRRLRPFGLRWGRWRMFGAMLWDSRRDLTMRDLATMLGVLVLSAHKLVHRGGVEPPLLKGRLAAYRVCVRCPFHEARFHRCAGCGCFMPFKLAAGGPCWAREQDSASGLGFSISELESSSGSRDPGTTPARIGEKDPSEFSTSLSR